MPSKSIASASEVAKLAGVSRSAVSRTFTPGASVSESTRNKVMAAAQTLNYHVNHLARGLSSERSRPVCILGADLNAPYQASLLDAITQRLQQAGRAVMVINSAGGKASSNSAISQTLNYRASATIVLSGTPESSLINTCLKTGQHLILVNRAGQFDGPDHITINYQSAMKKAYQSLLDSGCRKLAIISSTIQSPSLMAREKAFSQLARKDGIECELMRLGPTSYETGALSARKILNQNTPPDGIFCVTDLIACGFMDVARFELGFHIPSDLCVIGFDNIEQSGWLGYQLSTFVQPLHEMADAISTLLESALDTDRQPTTLVLEAPFISRHSLRL